MSEMAAPTEIEKDCPPVRKAVMESFGVPISISKTLDDIQVGASFVLDTDKMRKYALLRGRDKGIKLTSRKEEGRYRIWRVS